MPQHSSRTCACNPPQSKKKVAIVLPLAKVYQRQVLFIDLMLKQLLKQYFHRKRGRYRGPLGG